MRALPASMLLLVLTACGGSEPTSMTPSPAPTPTAPAGTTTVGTAGGRVTSGDGRFSLVIASGVLNGDTYFKITPQSALSGLADTYVLLSGTAYEIDWTGAGFTGQTQATLEFANPTSSGVGMRRVKDAGTSQGGSLPTSAVVQCGASDQIYATGPDPDASDYSDATVVMCSGSTQVGLAQPAPGEFPSIATGPADVSDTVGDTAVFSVVASGAAPLSYQWRSNGQDISGAVMSSYSVVAASSNSGTTYSVVVSNAFGSVTSEGATLTVGPPTPPAPPQWTAPTALTSFGPGIDLPQVGAIADTNVMVWSNNGVLDSDDATIHSLAHPIRSRPKVLTGPNISMGYIVFIDDDGTSSCPTGFGNQLSAIALGFSTERATTFPPSDPFPLYRSATDCITGFGASLSPDATAGIGVAFVLQQMSSGGMEAGERADISPGTIVNGSATTTWTPTSATASALPTSSDCAEGILSSDGMMGYLQAPDPVSPTPATLATLAYVSFGASGTIVCAGSLSSNGWSTTSQLFGNANQAEPVVAIDGTGRSLVLASLELDPTAPVLTFNMMAAVRPAEGGSWQPPQQLDSSDAAALPSAAFDGAGNALAVWRPNSSSGHSVVYMSRLSAAGAWDPDPAQPLSDPAAVETRYPRVCVDSDGRALALFEQNFATGAPFTVFSALWRKGLWSTIAQVQSDDGNDGRFADCARNVNLTDQPEIAWLETNPADSTQTRVVSSVLQAADE